MKFPFNSITSLTLLLKARGIDRLLGEFYDTLRNALFEMTLKETEPSSK